ncbi:MAG: type III secretion fhipep protein [Thermomicrobiales bacterium]
MTEDAPRPADICRQLAEAMGASEGRRARRKRDTTPDALGMGIKRSLLDAAAAADPDPDAFEAWLFRQVQDAGQLSGATRAMALQILDEWQFALASGGFRQWLASGAPSDDAGSGLSSSEHGPERHGA